MTGDLQQITRQLNFSGRWPPPDALVREKFITVVKNIREPIRSGFTDGLWMLGPFGQRH